MRQGHGRGGPQLPGLAWVRPRKRDDERLREQPARLSGLASGPPPDPVQQPAVMAA